MLRRKIPRSEVVEERILRALDEKDWLRAKQGLEDLKVSAARDSSLAHNACNFENVGATAVFQLPKSGTLVQHLHFLTSVNENMHTAVSK